MKEFPPYRLDPVNQDLRRTDAGVDEKIVLTPKAFELLRYFVDHAGRLVTHQELLDALWPDIHVQPEVIKGQILALRQVFGDDAKAPRYIETVRGRGYRFIAPVQSPAEDPEPASAHGGRPFVGRAAFLGDLQRWFEMALAGRSQLVFATGEPGIGKTALIDAFLATVSAGRSWLTARGQCVEGFGGTEPYYPVLEALGRLCGGRQGELVVQNLVSLAPTWAMQLPAQIALDRRNLLRRDIAGAGRERMLREFCDFLDVVSRIQPMVLIFEDLHWSDHSTIDLLSAIARRRSGAAVMVIASYRPEDTGPQLHPVKQVHHALRLRQLCHDIALGPLSRDAVAEFLGGHDGPASVPGEFASLVHDRSGGNPLFVRATLDHLVERGWVASEAGRWHLQKASGAAGFEIPHTLSQVIEARIRRLTDEQCRVVEAASIAGVVFAPATAASAAGLSPETFEDICEQLCRQEDFLRRDDVRYPMLDGGAQTYGFRHALYRQALYERQGPLRRRRGHRLIGQALEALCPSERRNEVESELAQHFAVAQLWSEAFSYLLMALQTAKQRFANREALEILDQASVLAARLPASERAAAELAVLESRAAVFMVEHARGTAESYERLAALAESRGEVDVQARALLGLAYATSWQDRAAALSVLDRAIALSDRQTNEPARIRTLLSAYAWKIWIGGWDDEHARKCRAALDRLEEGDDKVALAWGLLESSIVGLLSSRYEDAQAAVKIGYRQLHLSSAARPEFSLERAVWSYFLGIPLVCLLLGELGDSLQAFNDGIALFTRNGNTYATSTLRLHRAWLFLNCENYSEVIGRCSEIHAAHDAGAAELLPAEHRLCLLLIGLCRIGLGAYAEAAEILHDVARRMEDQPVIFDWYWQLPLQRGMANAAIGLGRPADAATHADEFLRRANATDERTWRGFAWETRARVALLADDTERAMECVEQALHVTRDFKTPLVDWHLLSTAAAVHQKAGNVRLAEELARAGEEKKAALFASLTPVGGL